MARGSGRVPSSFSQGRGLWTSFESLKPVEIRTLCQSRDSLSECPVTSPGVRLTHPNENTQPSYLAVDWRAACFLRVTRRSDCSHGRERLRSEEHTSELQSLRHLVCR